MKVLYYDCFSGISGDMNLGAMIDLGVEVEYLKEELNKLNLKGWELVAEKDQRHGITGTKVTVNVIDHCHGHGHHHHHDEHGHRHFSDIENIINKSELPEKVKDLSLNIFRKVAEAEAKVHGISVDKVHFHEVGAIDSIIDIVGAAICHIALGVESVHVSEVELGSGFVKCDHGTLPVPAPATAEIIKGIPVRKSNINFEATTPTGAAILSVLGTNFSSDYSMIIEKTGYGIGQKDHPDLPNVLRVSIGDEEVAGGSGHDALLISCNIDDMNPEFCDYISEKLFKAGASDVYISDIIMKKGRPGIVINVICEKELAETVKEILFTESTTLGIRSFTFRKDTLSREFLIINTEFGDVKFKRSFYKGNEVSCKPEYEDCKKIATEKGLPVKDVYNRLITYIAINK
ncbi:MAG: nickel pincer cofactor biosynthesis protein LarC [Bacteroidales bacterium]|jgi:uncharacterized protein (TIGR00299 family) protein|nr:nickel pincer cofactor biosynthesis protein LarC [Bacteroidales bacterium]